MNQRMAELARKSVPLEQVFDQLKFADLGWDRYGQHRGIQGRIKGLLRGDEVAASAVTDLAASTASVARGFKPRREQRKRSARLQQRKRNARASAAEA